MYEYDSPDIIFISNLIKYDMERFPVDSQQSSYKSECLRQQVLNNLQDESGQN